MDHLYRNHRNEQQKDNDSTMQSPPSLEQQNSSSFTYDNYTNRNSVSYSNDFRRISRTDDDLFELRLPSMSYTPRGSVIDQGGFLNNHDDDDDTFTFDNRARQ